MPSPARVALLLLVVAFSLRAQQSAEPTGLAAEPRGLDSTAQITAQSQLQPCPAPNRAPSFSKRRIDSGIAKMIFMLAAVVQRAVRLDYASTLNLRRRGVDEIFLTNSIVDNHPLFGGIEAAATAASIGVSYVFHRTGHHRLERWTSSDPHGRRRDRRVKARNYALKTAALKLTARSKITNILCVRTPLLRSYSAHCARGSRRRSGIVGGIIE